MAGSGTDGTGEEGMVDDEEWKERGREMDDRERNVERDETGNEMWGEQREQP